MQSFVGERSRTCRLHSKGVHSKRADLSTGVVDASAVGSQRVKQDGQQKCQNPTKRFPTDLSLHNQNLVALYKFKFMKLEEVLKL